MQGEKSNSQAHNLYIQIEIDKALKIMSLICKPVQQTALNITVEKLFVCLNFQQAIWKTTF